jgi:hypothetical protein
MVSISKFLWCKVCFDLSTAHALDAPADFPRADYWVLMIAVCTYLILANHRHQSSWIQDHKAVVWGLPWFLSILWAAIGLGMVGYGDIGACMSPLIPPQSSILIKRRVLVHLRSNSSPRQLHPPLANNHHHPRSLHQTILHHPHGPQPIHVFRRRCHWQFADGVLGYEHVFKCWRGLWASRTSCTETCQNGKSVTCFEEGM